MRVDTLMTGDHVSPNAKSHMGWHVCGRLESNNLQSSSAIAHGSRQVQPDD